MVGVQRDFRAIEHDQQFGLVCVLSGQQPVEAGKAGAAFEDAVEAGPQGGSALRTGIVAIGLEVIVEVPDQPADVLLDGAGLLGEGRELVHEPLRMHPAQAVMADIELTGIVADDHRVGEQAVRLDAAPQRPFGGDLHRIGRDLERGDAEPLEMRLPGGAIGEVLVTRLGQHPDDRAGKRAAAHVGERLGIDHIVAMAGAQQLKEVEPGLAGGRGEPGKAVVADLGAEAVRGLVARPGIVDRHPGCRFQARV